MKTDDPNGKPAPDGPPPSVSAASNSELLSSNSGARAWPPLPLMKNFDDAAALFEQTHDPFYLAAFMIQCWLGELVNDAAAEYAEKKNPRDRSVQAGRAWESFLQMFDPRSVEGGPPNSSCQDKAAATEVSSTLPQSGPAKFAYLLSCLFRFAATDISPGNQLRRALVPLSVEHNCTGDYFGPRSVKEFTRNRGRGSEAEAHEGRGWGVEGSEKLNELARRTIQRWCEWLDATIHLQTHRRWHVSPACFDPDPETRQLAALGNAQRNLAKLDGRAQTAWLWDFAVAAETFKDSPKWSAVGKAMSRESDRVWSYAEVDTLVIALWPLVQRYNWTYHDLLNVIRPALKRPQAYPCTTEQDFAAYCRNVLGLRKNRKGRTARPGRPNGWEIAHKLTSFPPPSASS